MSTSSRRISTTASPVRSRAFRALAMAGSAAVVALSCVLPVGAAQAAPSSPPPAAATAFADGKYIVILREAPVAAYDGGLAKFDATRSADGIDAQSRRVKSYSKHLATTQDDVAAAVGASITNSFTFATNGFSSTLTAEQAETLAADPRVDSVVVNEIVRLDAPETSTQFLGLDGDDGVWNSIGGVEHAGEGIVVGIIDSGIAPENPSFAGETLGTTAGSAPYLDGDDIVFAKSDGSTFRGTCEVGVQFAADDCSTKLVGARYFVTDFGAGNIGTPATGEYNSARDGNGHGSHTASTAAGNHDVSATLAGASVGEISGVAPAAKISAYKVCWAGPDHESPDDDGCATGDIIKAIDTAVADNVDVINYSIGSGAARTTVSLTDQAFFKAASSGIFVAAAAGNSGDAASTADNASPWITTVAASTVPTRDATARLGDGRGFVGASISLPDGAPVTGALVTAGKVAAEGSVDASLCGPGTLDPAKAAGSIVLCERGGIDRRLKSAEVARAGGIAMVLVNPTQSSLDLDAHVIPTVHLNADAYLAVSDYADTAGATVTLETGNTTGTPSAPSPQIAGFSSRGPILADGGDVLKPDIAAPGVAILAASANADGEPGTWEFMSGTSMASPHIAGLAALYLGVHASATPAEIKSAMMTTAYDTIDAAGAPLQDPFAQGAGQIDPGSYFHPGLLYLNDADDWRSYTDALGYTGYGAPVVDPSDLNLASISVGGLPGTQTVTRTVTATAAGTYTAQPVSMPGIDVTVTPTVLAFGTAGEEHSYTVTFTRTDAALDVFVTGYLDWVDGANSVRSPLAVRPISLDAPAEVAGTGATSHVDIPVLGGDEATHAVSIAGLARGVHVKGSGRAGGATQGYVVEVPEGRTFARFDLDADDDTADLDLSLYQLDRFNHRQLVKESATNSADERVDFDYEELAPGRYLAAVDFFAGSGDLGFTLTSYVLDPATDSGSPTVDPAELHTSIGAVTTVTASWSQLAPGSSFLGRIAYGDSGHSSVLTVTTSGTAVVPPAAEEPTASVDPRYVRAGDGIGLFVSGVDPGEAYSVTLDDYSSPAMTGIVTADGSFSRYVLLPGTIPLGEHRFTTTVGGESLTTAFDVTDVIAQSIDAWVDHDVDGNPSVSLDITFVGKGDLRVRLESADGTVYSDTTQPGAAPSDSPNYTFRTDPVAVTPGEMIGTLWVVTADGSMTQKKVTEFTAAKAEPSVITFAPNAQNANSVDVTYLNSTDEPVVPTVSYKLCTGPIIFAEEFFDLGPTTETWDVTGVEHLDIVEAGVVVASYVNAASRGCATAPKAVDLTVAQDFWVTMDTRPDTGDAEHPITLTVSNRAAVHSPGYDLSAGVGSDVFETDPILEAKVPTPFLEEKGPVFENAMAAAVDTPYWVSARFGQHWDWGNVAAKREARVPGLTLAQLAAVPAPGEPGGPGDPGDPGTPLPTPTPTPGTTPAPAQAGSPGSLANTGLAIGLPIGIAAALLSIGSGFVARRRRTASIEIE